MKVLFLISVQTHGRGGHIHSLNHIASAIGEKIEICVCSIGIRESKTIKENRYYGKHFYFNGINFFLLRKQLGGLMRNFRPDIIHCFDVNSFNIFTLIFGQNRFHIVLNLCGGPNPIAFPRVQNLVLFSRENKSWFEKQSKFNDSRIHVIPNRVSSVELKKCPSKLPLTKDCFLFFRIARIGVAYKKSIEDSITLVDILKQHGYTRIHLYIVGTRENDTIANEIEEKIEQLPITMLTDDEYTQKASDMLYLADAVIATGRGVMEATALGLPVLTPAKNSNIPLLITRENFQDFFYTNFSERNVASEVTIRNNYSDICKLIADKNNYMMASKLSLEVFDKYFNVNNGVDDYLDFYRDILKSKKSNYSCCANLIFKFRSILSFARHAWV